MNRQLATLAAREVLPGGLATAGFLLMILVSGSWLGHAVGALAMLAGGLLHRPPEPGTSSMVARALVAAGVLGQAAIRGYPVAVVAVAGTVLAGLIFAEPSLHRLARPWYHSAHLPAAPAGPARLVGNGTAWWAGAASVMLTGLVVVVAGPAWWLPLPALAGAGFAGWLLADGARRWRTAHRAELARPTEALVRHQPRFLLYFSAPPGSAYQVRMWLPQLERLGEPFLVVLAERHNLAPVAAVTGAPVVVCETFEALDAVMVPSLRAAFYVNNGMKNMHSVRFSRLTHVQLYHGDSDKAVTASPVNQLYDRIFVAGPAAIDRFAAYGVEIPAGRFRIVGRPQVAELAVATGPVRAADPPVVLYAPTWVGAHADSNYCSLPIAETIVAGLLERGATVIFRPHPYSTRDRASADHLRRTEQLLARDRARTGRQHRWGPAATTELSLFDCMNRSDAMICDISSVASDYLFTGKPFAITDMRGEGAEFTSRFPVARAAYLLRSDAGNLAAVLDDLLEVDPRQPVRAELRAYYLGDIPADRYAGAFLDAARDCLTEGPKSDLMSAV